MVKAKHDGLDWFFWLVFGLNACAIYLKEQTHTASVSIKIVLTMLTAVAIYRVGTSWTGAGGKDELTD